MTPMKAARIHSYGPAENFRIEEVPMPEPGPNDVLIEVYATAVNPIDWKMRAGTQSLVVRRKLPTTLGMDMAGVVEKVGERVTNFKPGDAVFSSPTHSREGTYAEYVVIDERELAHKPANVSFVEAASIPMVGLTAWGCFNGRVNAGDRVFIQAGSGGVGSFAVQLAKSMGATVSATCSGRNVELVLGLGADRVVDYTRESFWEVLEPQDLVLDSLGGSERKRLRQVLKRWGRMTSVNSELYKFVNRFGRYLGLLAAIGVLVWFTLVNLVTKGIRTAHVLRRTDGKALAEIAKLVESGAIRPVIDRTFPLEQIADAHRYSETGRARGKIVIDLKQTETPSEDQQ